MKKLVLFAAFAAVLGLSSCSNKAKVDSAPQDATEAVQPAAPAATDAAQADSTQQAAPDSTAVNK